MGRQLVSWISLVKKLNRGNPFLYSKNYAEVFGGIEAGGLG